MAWLGSFTVFHVAGGLIHLSLVFALMRLILRFVMQRDGLDDLWTVSEQLSASPRRIAALTSRFGLKGRHHMKLNRLLKSLLKTGVYIVDQTTKRVDRMSDSASDMADQAKSVLYPKEDHTLRNILSFVGGVGLGIGASLLLAPSSGAEIRGSIRDVAKAPTSTEVPVTET